MKKIVLGLLLASQFVAATNNTIKMPGKAVLQIQLVSVGMACFAEKTNIISQLAHTQKTSLNIADIVDASVNNYREYLFANESWTEPILKVYDTEMKRHKPLIFEALLKDEPAALEELKEAGIYKPIK